MEINQPKKASFIALSFHRRFSFEYWCILTTAVKTF